MAGLWIPLALASAFSLATSDALTKKVLETGDAYVTAWLRLFLSTPFLFIPFFFVNFPAVDRTFAMAVALAVPLEMIATVLYVKAIQGSPLSLTLPFLSLTPIFLLVVPRIVLGEQVSLSGGAGVLLIAAGGYLLNVRELRKGVWEPVRAIRNEKGSMYMIAVACIYSFTATLGKLAISHSSPFFFAAVYYSLLAMFLMPFAVYRLRKGAAEPSSPERSAGKIPSIYGILKPMVVPSLLYAVSNICHPIAVSMTNVSYMISVKRLSLLIGVCYGWIMFRETNVRERLLGAILMFAGFVTIVLSS